MDSLGKGVCAIATELKEVEKGRDELTLIAPMLCNAPDLTTPRNY
jgi:hypothetical protein